MNPYFLSLFPDDVHCNADDAQAHEDADAVTKIKAIEQIEQTQSGKEKG